MMTEKRLLRLLSLLLSFLMLMSATACAASDDTSISDSQTDVGTAVEAETEFDHGIERKNYNCDFVVTDSASIDTEYWYVEERKNDTMSDAVYERLELIKDYLGVTVKIQDVGDWTQYAPAVVRTVQSGDDAYQLVPTNTYKGIVQLITMNSLYDLNELPSLNLNASYWRPEVMDDLIIEGKRYLGYNDFCLSLVHLYMFNKDLMDQYISENPYMLVRNKQWTIDKLFSMASAVAVDDGDGKWTTKDTYGLAGWGWHGIIDMVTACDLKVVDKNSEGHYYVAYEDNTDKLTDVINKIYSMYTADYSWLWKSIYQDSDVIPMESGRILFKIADCFEPITMREYDIRLGILPYPLYDEAQENYRHLSWNGELAVPATIKNPEMVSDTIELLAAFAGPVKEAFYENLLGSKSSDTADDSEMLDIIWNSQVTDVGMVFCDVSASMDSLIYMVPKMCENKNVNLASYLKSYKKSAQKGLDRLFDK